MREHSALNRKGRISAPKGVFRGPLHLPLIEQGIAHLQKRDSTIWRMPLSESFGDRAQRSGCTPLSGVLRHYEGRSSAAADLIGKAVSLRPNDAAASNNLGVVLDALSRREEAVSAFDRAIAIRPEYAEAWNNRGNAFLGLARLGNALESYDRALVVKPDYAEAHNNRGVALHGLRRFAEAVGSFDRAIEARMNYAEAFTTVAARCSLLATQLTPLKASIMRWR